MKSHSGAGQANVATAHRIATIIYNMIKHQTEYDPARVSQPTKTMLEKRRKRLIASLNKLDKELYESN